MLRLYSLYFKYGSGLHIADGADNTKSFTFHTAFPRSLDPFNVVTVQTVVEKEKRKKVYGFLYKNLN